MLKHKKVQKTKLLNFFFSGLNEVYVFQVYVRYIIYDVKVYCIHKPVHIMLEAVR